MWSPLCHQEILKSLCPVLSSGHVSVGGGSARASEALLLRVPAPLLPGHVGGGDRRGRIGGHRQDPGHVLPHL